MRGKKHEKIQLEDGSRLVLRDGRKSHYLTFASVFESVFFRDHMIEDVDPRAELFVIFRQEDKLDKSGMKIVTSESPVGVLQITPKRASRITISNPHPTFHTLDWVGLVPNLRSSNLEQKIIQEFLKNERLLVETTSEEYAHTYKDIGFNTVYEDEDYVAIANFDTDRRTAVPALLGY